MAARSVFDAMEDDYRIRFQDTVPYPDELFSAMELQAWDLPDPSSSAVPTDFELLHNYLRPAIHHLDNGRAVRWDCSHRFPPAVVHAGLPAMNPSELPGNQVQLISHIEYTYC